MGLSLQDLYKLMSQGIIKYEVLKPSYNRVISQGEIDKFLDRRERGLLPLRKGKRAYW